MKKYKLIKKYPGSVEVGTEVTKQENGLYVSSAHRFFGFGIVENNPEFWEEVKEKEWEIIELKRVDGSDYTTDKAKIERYLRTLELGDQKYWFINKIKRLSDGEVFTVGEKFKFITPGEQVFRTIKRFAFSENRKDELLVFFEEDGSYKDGFKLEILASLIHYKEPLFTTEDGVSIYEDEGCFGVCIKEYSEDDMYKMYSLHSNIGWHSKPNEEYWKTFSTRENAEKYIQENKPKTVYGVNGPFTKTATSLTNKTKDNFSAGNWKWFNSEKERDLYIEENKPRFSKKDVRDFAIFFDKESSVSVWSHIDQLFARWANQVRKEK